MSNYISFVICLRIMGQDLDPDKITESLGIEPDNCHRAGDLHPIKKTAWKYGRWQYGLDGEMGESLDELIDEFLSDFEMKEDELSTIARTYKAVLSIGMCYLTKHVYAPSLEISAGVIKKIGDLGLAIDISAYPSTDEDDASDIRCDRV